MLLLPATLTHARGARHAAHAGAGAAARSAAATVVVDAGGAAAASIRRRSRCCSNAERLAQAWGKQFAVRQAPAKLAALARLYGVDGLLLKAEEPAVAASVADCAAAGSGPTV